jgi:hypothetical protein
MKKIILGILALLLLASCHFRPKLKQDAVAAPQIDALSECMDSAAFDSTKIKILNEGIDLTTADALIAFNLTMERHERVNEMLPYYVFLADEYNNASACGRIFDIMMQRDSLRTPASKQFAMAYLNKGVAMNDKSCIDRLKRLQPKAKKQEQSKKTAKK